MFGLGPVEIVIVGAVAVMLYGKNLPEVGRTVGKTVGDLRRQWNAMARELDVAAHVDDRSSSVTGRSRGSTSRAWSDEGPALVSGPRFDPPESDG